MLVGRLCPAGRLLDLQRLRFLSLRLTIMPRVAHAMRGPRLARHTAILRSLCPKITDMEPQFGSKPGASLSNAE
jgi:hypothetical protein